MQSNIFVWGDNSCGQLALKATDEMKFVQDPIAVNLAPVSSVLSIACGRAHSVIVSKSGQIFAFGDNSKGQLGLHKEMTMFSYKPVLVDNLPLSNGRMNAI